MAVKVYDKTDLKSHIAFYQGSFNQLDIVRNEIKIWSTIYHNNFIKVFKEFDDLDSKGRMYLMMELAQNGQI